MAETEASAAHAVDEDGKTAESTPAEPEQTPAKAPEQPEVSAEANSKDTVNKEEVVADGTEAEAALEASETPEAPAGSEGEHADATEATSSAEHKTSLLDSFLHKSGLGKVMGSRKKKESPAAGAEETTAEGGTKDGEKNEEKSGEEAQANAEEEEAAEGEGEKEGERAAKEEDKKDKSKSAEAKSTVRDFIRKPVARIFSHRSTDKKDGSEPQKHVKVRSKSLDRIEDAEALNTTDPSTEEGATGGAEEEGELKASSAQAKHMRRWHSFKKMMAQKTHKKSSGGGEDGKEEGAEGEGGGDSSTLDSKESGQKRWKLKRSWTFQGLKRDPSIVGISSKAKGADKEATEGAKGEEEAGESGGEAQVEGAEGPSAEGGEEEKSTTAAGVGAVTQHANEIWTSFKKRVIPKSKRTNTECAPEEDAAGTLLCSVGEEGSSEEGKDGKSAKAKRSHFGRAVSLKNFILRKGKSTSVDMSEGAKEEEGAADGEEADASAQPAADGESVPPAEGKDGQPTDTEAPAKSQAEEVKSASEEKKEEKASEDHPLTNCENGCTNGTDDSAHNHQDEDSTSPVKKSKVSGDNAKIINTTAPCNSGESPLPHLDTSRGGTNHTHSLQYMAGDRGQGGSESGQESPDENMRRRKGQIREAAVAIVENVMSAATDQLERELCTSNGH
ncbi:hypothetical protein NL108_000276 [Boleophthalmus pectinirostris]|nr:hypothetical protein NL108_000276 [Boleophthalmus pectinirostris]